MTYWFIKSRDRKHETISQIEEKPAERKHTGTWGGWGNWSDQQTQASRIQESKVQASKAQASTVQAKEIVEEQQMRFRRFKQSVGETVSVFLYVRN